MWYMKVATIIILSGPWFFLGSCKFWPIDIFKASKAVCLAEFAPWQDWITLDYVDFSLQCQFL